MSVGFYVRRAMSMPPHELAGKVWQLLGGQARAAIDRRRDRRQTTYAPAASTRGLYLARYFPAVEVDLLRPHRDRIGRLAERAMRHEFDLLGSGLLRVGYHRSCPGREQWHYDGALDVRADHAGAWLGRLVTPANHPRAAEIWSSVSGGYEPIDWSRDFISGYRWPTTVWSQDCAYANVAGVDIKVPWELGRMQHLPVLAHAFALARAGEPGLREPAEYAKEFQDQLLDFMAVNPPRFGVQWNCAMDVGIRVANWLAAYDLLAAYGADFSPRFLDVLCRAVYEHGRHVVDHLEWFRELRSNHYLANLAGLIFAGAYLQGSQEPDDWLRFAARELVSECGTQFHADGSSFEASIGYHRLSAEMVVYATALLTALAEAKRQAVFDPAPPPAYHSGTVAPALKPAADGSFLPEWYWQRLERMGEFTLAMTRPDGRIAQFGDNDSGRFLKLWPCERETTGGNLAEVVNDHRHLLAAIGGLCQREELSLAAGADASVETAIVRALVGPCPARPSTIRQSEPDEQASVKQFGDFGVFVFERPPFWLAVRCGPNGQLGNGGHAHNDQLSFELTFGDLPLLVDPGTYLYTPDRGLRDRFRSTASHNTLAIDGREQNTWDESRFGMFALRDEARPRVIEISADTFCGEHVGFGQTHRRWLRITPQRVEGRDECAAAGTKRIYFHVAPGVKAMRTGSGVKLTSGSRAVSISADRGRWSIEDAWYSPGYGVKERAVSCHLAFDDSVCHWSIEHVA